jgi:hypothetical protein
MPLCGALRAGRDRKLRGGLSFVIGMSVVSRRVALLLAAAVLGLACAAVAPTAGACAGPCSIADYDGDGVNDWGDNCPTASNASQRDTDKDTPAPVVDAGQASGLPNTGVISFDSPVRLYPETPYQAGQAAPSDFPPDKGGDACDDDDDSDGVKDRGSTGKPPDNCPLVPNADQKDVDGDGIGDACDDANTAPVAAGTAAAPPVAGAAPAAAGRGAVRASAPRALRFDEIALGIIVPVRCSARCQVAGELVLDRRSGRRVRLPRRTRALVVGRGSAFLEGAGTTYLFVKVPARSLRRLARSFRALRPLLRVTVQGRAVSQRRLELHR